MGSLRAAHCVFGGAPRAVKVLPRCSSDSFSLLYRLEQLVPTAVKYVHQTGFRHIKQHRWVCHLPAKELNREAINRCCRRW